ncbi:MAG: hypothetical protein AAFR61_23245 [Bacteroidota bacterium]
MSQESDKQNQDLDQELRKVIPWARSWKFLYGLVLGELILLILLFIWFSRAFV